METNKAPKKVYLHLTTGCRSLNGKYNEYKPAKIRIDDKIIEYIRTDAFMKKVENFLKMLGCGFTITDNITHANYDKEQLIEDFRNYIKGE